MCEVVTIGFKFADQLQMGDGAWVAGCHLLEVEIRSSLTGKTSDGWHPCSLLGPCLVDDGWASAFEG